MEISQNCPVTEPVISTTLKKKQPLALDTFGPFPDETILSGIDRVLFFLGVKRVRKYLNLPTPSCGCSSNSDCSITLSCLDNHGRYRSLTKLAPGDLNSLGCKSDRSTSPCPLKSLSKKGSCIVCNLTKQSSAPNSDALSICGMDGSLKTKHLPIKRSFSLCSLACRKLKQAISNQSNTKEEAIWLWTHMQCYPDGTRVLQIFENPTAGKPPNTKSTQPKIIIVMMSNGTIIPFEGLKCH